MTTTSIVDVLTGKTRVAELKRLKEIRSELASMKMPTTELDARIEGMNSPHVGDVLFVDAEGQRAVRVVHVEHDRVQWVPAGIVVGSTHKGNLYDDKGGSPYA